MSEILLRSWWGNLFLPLLLILILQLFLSESVLSQDLKSGQIGTRLSQVDIVLAKVTSGQASLSDIKSGLRAGKPGDTANILHALYAMRDSLIVKKLLHSMWYGRQDLHPDIPWERLQSPVVRVALASTLNRIFHVNNQEFLDYIRGQKDNEIFLVRSQVAVSLGINGDPGDIDVLAAYVLDKSDHVARSAVTGLAFMYSPKARDELIRLLELQRDNSKRKRLIQEALLHTYDRVEDQ